jgi:hypothetical protein
MRIYLDRGHRTNGGARDEWRQVGVFLDCMEGELCQTMAEVVRTPDELDSFTAQTWALEHLAANPTDNALYIACHADVGSYKGLVFFDDRSHRGAAKAWDIAEQVSMVYSTVALPTSTKGYERTGGCLGRITASPANICGVLLELWRVDPVPTDDAIREVAVAVARAL